MISTQSNPLWYLDSMETARVGITKIIRKNKNKQRWKEIRLAEEE
jgi:hypothetical protein